MSNIRLLVSDPSPYSRSREGQHHRALALATDSHVLVLRHSPAASATDNNFTASSSSLSLNNPAHPSAAQANARCQVEFLPLPAADLGDFKPIRPHAYVPKGSEGVYGVPGGSTLAGGGGMVHGTLGLVALAGDVFLCVVSAARKVAEVRPGETVQRILGVEFYCLNSGRWDGVLDEEVNPYPTDTLDEEGFEQGYGPGKREGVLEHPCMALKKLLSSGTFYYSVDFDLTRRLQKREQDSDGKGGSVAVAIDSLDAGFLWNSYMIQPLVDFRSTLGSEEKAELDQSGMLTSAIRGFAGTIPVPAASSPARRERTGLPSTLTLISRLSCRRAGTRFNARGIDDDGNVANFVESETIFWTPGGVCFSYAQVRGSVPVFWEQSSGLLPGQQKITITRSPEATQPAFDKHFERLEYSYGAVHVVNLLSNEKSGELELTQRYREHIKRSSLNSAGEGEHELLKVTDYDFHAETREGGYEAASLLTRILRQSAEGFAYYLAEEREEKVRRGNRVEFVKRPVTVLQQEGVFRTNCLDCLDRTNLVQTIISRMAVENFLAQRGERAGEDFWVRHGSLWADNGDALSRIYAGTGALKSSFTRHGKMSLAGALADARKSATRMYINNFADKGRQNTIDMLLGRLVGQPQVVLYDPINEYVRAELTKRASEFTSVANIGILVATFNLNGRTEGIREDLSPWLCPKLDGQKPYLPEIVAVGFQEIVELSPQQIMSTDPSRRQMWEAAVKETLNRNAESMGVEEYVLLRGGQLVGASLSILVRSGVLGYIKNVEGSLKKTGMSGMAGNKGAVAIRMEYANTSLCFVTAHLAAGFANYEERNRDYRTIAHGLRFQRNRVIEDHENVIWLGDFNYRIGLSNDKVRKLIELGDLETLYDNDQLNIQMVAGMTFPFYSEGRITFLPTYKYDVGTDQYDTSEKSRIPAWCDRVLRKGDNLRQTSYNTAPLKFSDHRPVYASFQCTVTMVDEKKKERLHRELYSQRRAKVGNITEEGDADDSDEDDLIEYEPIEPGLPPASSDKRKWWLDNGMPARTRVQPPAEGFFPNPKRPSNPFTPSPEPDWVDIRHDPSFPRKPAANGSASANNAPSTALPKRKLVAPPFPPPGNGSAPKLPPRTNSINLLDDSPSTGSSIQQPLQPQQLQAPLLPSSRSSISTASSTNVAARKPAPPVPKKPSGLASSSSSPNLPASPLAEKKQAPPSLPPPRRSGTMPAPASPPASLPLRQPSVKSLSGMFEGGGGSNGQEERPPPPLPKRTGTGLSTASANGRANGSVNVMDDEISGDSLGGWEVLKPGGR